MSRVSTTDGKRRAVQGIIPLQALEIDPRVILICDIANLISEAITGPGIGAFELAEMILDTVDEAAE